VRIGEWFGQPVNVLRINNLALIGPEFLSRDSEAITLSVQLVFFVIIYHAFDNISQHLGKSSKDSVRGAAEYFLKCGETLS